jgi:putative Mg2+ transporter-C (MgtC) family protein
VTSLLSSSFFDFFTSLTVAFLLGGVIGIERQYRQRTAGLRTNVLVAVGACLFVDIGHRLTGNAGAAGVLAYVVSGVGFLGAGVIMREEGNVRGINTAATLWGSAAVGACAGANLVMEAILGAVFVLAANTLLRPVVNRINRAPVNTTSVEATYTIFVIALKTHQRQALQQLEGELEQARYPTQDLTVHSFGDDSVEIEAVLSATSVDSDLMDMIVMRMSQNAFVTQSFWNSNTAD